jgi:DNA-binding Lrp family transcriptional regulator
VDTVDRAIVRHLQANARLANTELADKVGLTPSPCLRRVRALEEAGVITGYHAAVDPVALGRGFRVLVHIEMATQDMATIEAFESQVADVDAVEECLRLFGQPDYLLWVAVADLPAYEALYMSTITRLPGVASSREG